MATFRDSFDRPASLSLGSPWLESETFPEVFEIIAGSQLLVRAEDTDPAGGGVHGYAGLAVFNEATDDGVQFSRARVGGFGGVGTLSPTDQPFSGPAVRLSGSVASCSGYIAAYTRFDALSSHGVTLLRCAGTDVRNWRNAQILGSVPIAAAFLPFEVQLLASGSSIEVSSAGATLLQVVDTTLATGQTGFVALGSQSYSGVGNLALVWDDWAGVGLLLERPTVSLSLLPTSYSAGGGLHEMPVSPIVIVPSHEIWHREHIKLGTRWIGSSVVILRNQQAGAEWRVESVVREQDRFPLTPPTHAVRSDVTVL